MAGIMLQGTGSDVGKSVLVAGLCRLFTNRGMSVRPFKPQNMSNNAAVAFDGGEIGRAQALQAIACRTLPSIHMNPVLIKPQSDTGAQIIIHGKVVGPLKASDYKARKASWMEAVLSSWEHLNAQADLVIVEGAGSPAEINLRAGDIANMGFARATNTPVILVGDIDRGGVIASLVGTKVVLDPADEALIAGFIINKFRGDVALFNDGYAQIAQRTGWLGLGVIPWLPMVRSLPAEDGVVLERASPSMSGNLKIAVLMLSRIANFDDMDALAGEPSVALTMVRPGEAVASDTDLVIIPGTKATIADLAFLRGQGWDIDIAAHLRRGGRVIGICGGYQMLGHTISDPNGVEGPPETVSGLGFLDVDTVMAGDKTVRATSGTRLCNGAGFDGYEIHLGQTMMRAASTNMPLLAFADGRLDGAITRNGLVAGCYVHGLFNLAEQRRGWLNEKSNGLDQNNVVDTALDELAEALSQHLNIDAMLAIARRTK